MNCFDNTEKKCLIEDVKNLLSGGWRSIEITDEAFCTLIKFATEELTMNLQQFLINERWGNLVGKDVSKTDICIGLTTRSLDYEGDFATAYSAQAGLQFRGNLELKKDYIDVVEGVQSYVIPADRLINRVLWSTPSDIDQAVFQSMSFQNTFGYNSGANGSYGMGLGSNDFINNAYYIAPAFDIMLRAADVGLKNRIRQSDLTYSVTAGPNGTKILHLYSIPNHGNQIGVRKNMYKCKVWYFYYDTADLTAEEKNKCLEECKDIIKYPTEIPMAGIDYCDLNMPSKVWVRKYLTALAKESLGRARGKFSNALKIPNAEAVMDGDTLLAEAKEEKKELIEDLKSWLEQLRSDKMLERKANEAQNLNTVLKFQPHGNIFVI